ncbi:hypothetical protein PTTG_25777 [Puccinia triticina 1-1 BBBD Race 1]|uniref:Retrotransposon gag domain-containing protein n=1 Tax=Puccinia triticina (isolate 1-1 / race 1 (BBBD)) TaxID=630390 RepID=A0A180H124_PUCT1|nr:hypothetical protein PTTG_25777 [Puccinia triticina 1-1 BBBD Race 1]
MSTRRTVLSDQLLDITDIKALIRAANKAKRLAAKSLSSNTAPGPSNLKSSTPGPLTAPAKPTETSSCPASLASSFVLPPAVGFQAPSEPSLFPAAPADPPNVWAWEIIPLTKIRPPPPPSGPIYPLISAPLALPPPKESRPSHVAMNLPDPANKPQTAMPNLTGPPPRQAGPIINTAPPAPSVPMDHSIMGIFAEMQRMTLQMQQANFNARLAADQQAQEDRNRLRRLEEAVTKVLVTPTEAPSTTLPRDGRIDLQRFHTLDVPVFTGPFQDVEVFLTWIYGLEVFFGTKAVTLDSDKIRIKESNLLSFYSNKAAKYLSRTWVDFKEALFTTALPLCWRREIKGQIRNLRMMETETFT